VPTGEYECGDYPCFDDAEAWEERIALPEGFVARYVAQLEPHPTSITFGPDDRLYVARQEGEIVTVDADGNVEPFMDGFYYLVAIAFQPGTERLFASTRVEGNEAATIWVIEDGEARPLYEGLPCCYGGWHQANGIAFGPDGYGYVAVGALSDHGERQPLDPMEATVLRFDPAGAQIEVFARGLRNTFDIGWDGSGRLFGADNMPDHGPPEEFNRIEPGGHHGFPYYDDCAGCEAPPDDLEIVPPLHDLLAHSAPTGLTSYLAQQFPGYYNNIFLTLWSSFPGAQKIVRFGPNGEGMTDFATGFAAPVDVTVSPDGSLYVVDWATGIVFEIVHSGDGSR
jgi:glucose/arabinose dehydrogenase